MCGSRPHCRHAGLHGFRQGGIQRPLIRARRCARVVSVGRGRRGSIPEVLRIIEWLPMSSEPTTRPFSRNQERAPVRRSFRHRSLRRDDPVAAARGSWRAWPRASPRPENRRLPRARRRPRRAGCPMPGHLIDDASNLGRQARALRLDELGDRVHGSFSTHRCHSGAARMNVMDVAGAARQRTVCVADL
jgi:hypothetical protein